jgi:hypothetical protein
MHLRKAEEEVLYQPEVRQLVEHVRKMYREDPEGIFTAFAVTTQEKDTGASHRVSAPPSRIPRLLSVLLELAQRSAARKVSVADEPSPPLPGREARFPGTPSQKPSAQPAVRAPEDQRERELMREIEQAKKALALVKKDETLIRTRRGKYSVPGERLRAERLLRELPGQIAQMERTLQLLREGVP